MSKDQTHLPKVAVIPAAGKGTRFLPSTKATPKELHPLLNRPLIHHCLEELKEAGVEEAIVVTHPEKTSLRKYFSSHTELKDHLKKGNKLNLVKELESIESLPKVTFVDQIEQRGLAHAVLCAKEAIGDRDFFLLLPDEIFLFNKGLSNPSVELLERFKKDAKSAISLLEIDPELVSSYGVAQINKETLSVTDIVEKPKVSEAPSNLILPGRYLFKNRILNIIENTPESQGEIPLTDAIVTLSQEDGVSAVVTQSERYDGGSVLGFLKANIAAAMKEPKIKEELQKFLNTL